MTWRGRSGALDRFYSCLLYILPLATASVFGLEHLFRQIPALIIPYLPFLWIELNIMRFPLIPGSLFPLTLGFVVFFVIFATVVRNQRLLHFIRFNGGQALLIEIAAILGGLLLGLLRATIGVFPFFGFIDQTISSMILIGATAAVVYAIVQAIRGRYGEIPIISDAAYYLTRV
ncbi:hypothetical protein Pse7367_2698 [Thalassoporum mexicanum PCC 7367]|uniref:Tic20 family protein n=1 Tax=Thalassoporum mexicanum TaxID=3457544 RepID=UPI00029FD7D6|nr:Tic20 family protein [Pseudanabaena sp. PCC 7367]AFY70953.1 hypothetical protein Pse7367_2698 [Pseudanabaena sp. PCC 7367]